MTITPFTKPLDQLWYTRCPVPTASGIAIHHGWINEEFARDGIAVSSLRASADRSVRESHFDHRQANSFRQGGNAPPIWSRSQGQDVVVVGLTWLPQYQSILALGGLTERDVTLVDLPVEEPYIGEVSQSASGPLFDAHQFAKSARAETFALIRGEVDAIYHYGAAGPALQTYLGAHVVLDINHHADQKVAINNGTPNVLTVSGELLRKHPAIVARYLAQVLRAARWARAHRQETAAIVAREVSVAEEWVPEAFDASLYDNLEPSLRPDLVSALETRKDFMLRHGFIQNDFSVAEWIDPGPLAEAHKLLRQFEPGEAKAA